MKTHEKLSSDDKKNKKFFLLSMISILVGFFLSLYSTIHHMQVKSSQDTSTAMCNINDIISCDKVAQSSYSEFLTIPLGVWGLCYFLILFFLLALAYQDKSKRAPLLGAYNLFTLLGVVGSVGLGFISFVMLQSVCIVCVGIYCCNFFQGFLAWKNKDDFGGGHFSFIKLPQQSLAMVVGIAFVVIGSYKGFLEVDLDSVRNTLAETQRKAGVKLGSLGGEAKALKDAVSRILVAKNSYMAGGEDYRKGSDKAPVIVHEFADFQCGACKHASKILKEVQDEVGSDKLQIVFRNFPLFNSCNPHMGSGGHKFACMAAKAARCLGAKGKFWAMHDEIFEGQESLSEASLREKSAVLGLNSKDFDNCLQDKRIAAKLLHDIEEGRKLGVSGTPSLFINGKLYQGNLSKNSIISAINALLNKS